MPLICPIIIGGVCVCVCESVSAIRRALQVGNCWFFVLITEKQSTRGAATQRVESVQVS